MNNKNAVIQIFYFMAYIGLQILLAKNLVLFDKAFCFVYVAFLLLLPFELGSLLLMAIGFVMGLVIDIFYDSLGIHAAACVLIMYLRPYWVNLITPRGGYEIGMEPSLKIMKFEWFATYAIPLIFVHHLALFFIEAGGLHLFFFTIAKVLLSTIFTFIAVIIIQYLFYTSKRSL